jgi:hypothetical protein
MKVRENRPTSFDDESEQQEQGDDVTIGSPLGTLYFFFTQRLVSLIQLVAKALCLSLVFVLLLILLLFATIFGRKRREGRCPMREVHSKIYQRGYWDWALELEI